MICGFPSGRVVKNPPAKAGDTGSIPGSGRITGVRKGNPPTPVFLPGEFPWTEEPGGLQSMGLKRAGHSEHACMHMLTCIHTHRLDYNNRNK